MMLSVFGKVVFLTTVLVHMSHQQCTNWHTVQSGEVCQQIWTDNGLAIKKFYLLNPEIDCYNLQMGQQVCIADILEEPLFPGTTANRVVGCFSIWGSRPFSAMQAQLLTHVIVEYADMAPDGSLSFSDEGKTITQLKQTALSANPKLRVMFSFGDNRYWSSVAANPTVLVNSIVSMIKTYQLDGVNVNWKYPATASDKSNYVALMQKIRVALNDLQSQFGGDYQLSFVGAAKQNELDVGFDLPGLLTYANFVTVSTYLYYESSAYTGPNSPLYGTESRIPASSVDWTLSYYTCRTKKPFQLNLFIPFFCLYWINVEADDPMYRIAPEGYQTKLIPWKDIPQWQLASASWSSSAKIPYYFDAKNKTFHTFENATSIAFKGHYAKDKNIGGISFWELDYDDDQYSLLKAVAKAAAGLRQSNIVKYEC